MAKRGRPVVEDPRVNNYNLMMNSVELGQVQKACKLTGMRTSDMLREAVKRLVESEENRMED